jgi:DNA-binding transcriptional regulator YdaS (Cro superfamily)
MSFAPGHAFAGNVSTLAQMNRIVAQAAREFQAYIGNHQTQLADQLGILPQTVQSWFKEERISVWGANAISKRFPAFPRERLRPDVIDWPSALKKARAPQKRRKVA